MTNLSPHERSVSANRSNKSAIVVFGALLAIVFMFAYLKDGGVPMETALMLSPGPDAASGRIQGEDPFLASEDWTAKFDQLTINAGEASPQIVDSLNRTKAALLKYIATSNVSPDSDFGKEIEANLGELGRMPRDRSEFPETNGNGSVELNEVSSWIGREVDRQLKQEQIDLKSAIDTAVEQVKRDRAPQLRTAKLEFRDAEDTTFTKRVQTLEAANARLDEQQQTARLAALQRDMANIRAYLSPFITPGHVQPNSRKNAGEVKRTFESIPVSLSLLERLGALEPTLVGLEQLFRFAGDNNDRPLGSFPRYNTLPGGVSRREVRPLVETAQNLLRQHGQALIETNMLSR